MILMGDEVRRSQSGNNNAYCYDSDLSWFDWTLLSKLADVLRFVKLLIARRLLRQTEHERQRLSLNQLIRISKHAWHGVRLHQPDWSDWSHSLALGMELPVMRLRMHLILNAYWEPLDFELPAISGGGTWLRWIDTALDPPQDIVEWQKSPPISGSTYQAGPRTVVVLFANLEAEGA
jgi:glycogen operon protein